MRTILSVLALVVVLAVVMKLAATQLRAFGPPSGAASAAGSRSAVEQQAVDRVQRAIQQGQAIASDASR